jgi:hypothetical protein
VEKDDGLPETADYAGLSSTEGPLITLCPLSHLAPIPASLQNAQNTHIHNPRNQRNLRTIVPAFSKGPLKTAINVLISDLGAFPAAPETGLSGAPRFRAPAPSFGLRPNAVAAPHPFRSKSAGFATPCAVSTPDGGGLDLNVEFCNSLNVKLLF